MKQLGAQGGCARCKSAAHWNTCCTWPANVMQRVHFGRKIAQFQAIQHELAPCGGEVAAAVAAALSAAGVVERQDSDHSTAAAHQNLIAVAAAKIRAANEAVAITHPVHGAIGVTDEHALHHVTLRTLK